MLEHKISWEVLKIFAQKHSYDDLRLTLTFFYSVRFAFRAFIWELVEDFGAKVVCTVK